MAGRTVSVTLTAQVTGYLANVKAAADATRALEQAQRDAAAETAVAGERTLTAAQRLREQEKATRDAETALRKHNEALKATGVAFLAVGATAAAGIALAVKASAEYGSKMAQLQSLSHASKGDMQALSDAAMTVGKAYGFSASQVADAEIELTKAGVTVQQQLGGALKGALTLAAAGQMNVADATEIATVAMTQYNLQAKDVPHLADLLSAGADKALGSVADLGEGLKNGGLQAHNMGLTLNDTVGTLAAFANQGILGAEAGTQLRSMFLRLQNPTAGAKATLSEYGIAINDASGKFVGITKFAGELHDRLDGLTQAQRNAALATVFGSHAIIGATALYQYGAKGIGEWIAAVNEGGFASAQAAGKMNSLAGDWQKLNAQIQTDAIKAGQGAEGPLRGIVQSATSAAGALADIPAPVASGAMAAATLTAGIGLLGGGFLVAVPKLAAFRKGLEALNMTGRGALGLFGKGAALTAGVAVIGSGLAAMGEHGVASTDDVKRTGASAMKNWEGLDGLFGSSGMQLGDSSGMKQSLDNLSSGAGQAAKFVDGLTFGMAHLSDVYKGNEATFDGMGQQLASLAQQDYGSATQSFGLLASKWHLGADEQKALLDQMPAYKAELTSQAIAAHVTVNTQNLLNAAQGKGAVGAKMLAAAQAQAEQASREQAAAVAELAGKAAAGTSSVKDLEAALKNLDGGQLSARAAARAFQQAIDDADAALKKNGRTLDIHTQAGRDNQAALDGIASAAEQSAKAVLAQSGDSAKAAKVLHDGREQYVRVAEAMGLSAGKARALADALFAIPPSPHFDLHAKGTDGALQALIDLQNQIAKVNGSVVTVDTVYSAPRGTLGGAPGRRAGGGSIDGAGPKGVDSVPIIAAPGEHMLTTADVDAMGGQGAVYDFRASLHGGSLPGYAKGGAIRRHRSAHPAAHHTKPKRPKVHHPSGAALALAAIEWGGRVYAKGSGIVRESDVARQDRLARTAGNTITSESRALKRAQAAEKAAQKRQDAAQKRYDAIGAGKANAAAKRSARAALNTAKAKTKAAAKRVADDQKAHDAAVQARDAAKQAAATLRQNREDFQSAERRDPTRRDSDPLQYVDQLRQMSRDSNFSTGRQKKFDAAANQYEAALVGLAKTSADAAKKLDDLKTTSEQLHDSVASAVSGGFRASSAGSSPTASGWITRNGMRFQQYTTGPTAASLASYYSGGASKAKRFADGLAKLAAAGWVPAALLSEVAGYGSEQGQPVVDAMLAANAAQRRTIASGYNTIGTQAGRAGTIAADDQYAKAIASAKANADAIQKTITTDGEKLRKMIATAFGLKGYASGTSDATAGVHLVGEQGPELVGFRGGEWVANAASTARWVRGMASGGSGSGGDQPVVVQVPPFPDTITVQDASGFTATMRVVAHDVVTQRHDDLAVRLMGASV